MRQNQIKLNGRQQPLSFISEQTLRLHEGQIKIPKKLIAASLHKQIYIRKIPLQMQW